MLKTRQSREFWLLAVVALLVLGAGLGLRDPWPADEPRFVLVAKQMWESGDWWFPHRGQVLYPDKPPLYFWLLGASYALVRDWTVAFLLPSLLAALGTLWLTFDLGRRLWDRRAGLWAAAARSEEHTSELQSLMRISYAVFCLKKKKNINLSTQQHYTEQ